MTRAAIRFALGLLLLLLGLTHSPASADDVVIIPRIPIDRKFPAIDWCQVQNTYEFTAPSCSLFIDFGVKLTGSNGGSFGQIGLDDVLVTRYSDRLEDPTCSRCPNWFNGATPIHNWCYESDSGNPNLEETFSGGWQANGWKLGPGVTVGPLNGSQALLFQSAPGVPAAPCDTARARLALTGLTPGMFYSMTLWWSVEFPQPNDPLLWVSFSRPAACPTGSCGVGNCFKWPNLPYACSPPVPANLQASLVSNGSAWYARATWRRSAAPGTQSYRVYRSATANLGAAVTTSGHFLATTTDTFWTDAVFSLAETNYYVLGADGLGKLGLPAEAPLPIPAGEHIADSNTLLLLHFNGHAIGASGESPSIQSGITYEAGPFGQGAYFANPSQLFYPSAGNISPTTGTLDFWIKPRWTGGDGNDHYLLRQGDEGGILIGKDAGNYWRSIFNRYGPVGTEAGTGHFITTEWPANLWRHNAFTWSPTQLALYIDGELVESTFPQTAPPEVSEPLLQIGADGDRSYLDAVLDEVRLSNVERTPAEIRDSFQRRSLVGVANPTGTPGAPLTFRSVMPNPIVESARIGFAVTMPTRVQVDLIDVTGRLVEVLHERFAAAGEHSFNWGREAKRGGRVRPGIYFVRLRSAEGSVSRRVAIL